MATSTTSKDALPGHAGETQTAAPTREWERFHESGAEYTPRDFFTEQCPRADAAQPNQKLELKK